MNLFYLDENIEKCAEFHIDKHVSKMILECAQLMCTCLWIDRLFGYTPRAIDSHEHGELRRVMAAEPDLEDRTFVPYKASHHNHPSAIWMRTSLEHYYWAHNYANELQREALYRGRNPHKSLAVINNLPDTIHLIDKGFTPPTPAMPDELKSGNTLQDYRLFYMLDKAAFSSWKGREKPYWWDEDVALYEKRYTDMTEYERKQTGWLS